MGYVWDGDLGPEDPATEDSVARAFAEREAGQLCYCAEHRCWYVFEGTVWRRDRTGHVLQRARELARELGTSESGEGRHGSQTVRFVGGVERFARADPTFSATADLFDADPFLLGTPDGPVDLRDGRRLEADPSQYLTRATAVGPAETADCPLWLRVLDQTFEDPALVRFVQQYLGYALTGDTSEQVLLFGHGTGGNGKSVLMRTVAGLMGDYAASVTPGSLTGSGRDRHPTELARLDGVRLVHTAETDADATWDETRLKLLTGGDPVTARFMRRDAFTFTPRFKLVVLGNRRPAVRHVDEALRRRLCLVPFDRRPEVPDRTLAEKLKAEWPGILRWMIEGCLDWQANGLLRPPRVLEATADYLGTQDVLGQFLDEACDCDPARTAPAGALFEAWSAYARAAGETVGSQRGFAEALRARGFSRARIHAGRIVRGLGLKTPAESAQPDRVTA